MYESPITIYMQEIMTTMENERENAITAKISESIGVDIDKGELIKALQYDRHQYNKGYADAKAEYESMLNQIRAEIANDWQLKDFSCSPFSCGLRHAIEIIDKYRKESEEMQDVVKRKAGTPREDYEPLYSCENWIP